MSSEFSLRIETPLAGRPAHARRESLRHSLQSFVRRNRVSAVFLGFTVIALLAGMSLALWQVREARAAAESARREAARATASKDFLFDVFRASDARIAQGKLHGLITARELLDLAVPKIGERFRDDPATQIELLEMTASLYRELGEEVRYRTINRQRLEQVRQLHGDTHPDVIGGLLDDAHYANNQNDHGQALRLLEDVDPLIRKAGLDESVTRARWWLVRGGVLKDDYAVDPDALDKAMSMYRRLAPMDTGYVRALTSLGLREMRGEPAKAEQHFLQAIAAVEKNPARIDRELQLLTWSGLAQAHEEQGRYEAAIEAYERGAALIAKVDGVRRDMDRVPTAKYAWALHRYGLRDRALELFEQHLSEMLADGSGNFLDEHARELYADRLAAEGRPAAAIPLLESALEAYRRNTPIKDEVRRSLLILGDAYDRAGLDRKARGAIKASLDEWLQKEPPGSSMVSIARERWGRYLLTHDDLSGAQAQFDEVLTQANGQNSEVAVMAYGGLSRLAQARRDADMALASSTHAVVGFENLSGPRDVRTGPYLWLIHAESLRRVDDDTSARIWVQRALEASQRYDASGAPSIREAENLLAKIGR